MKTLHLFVIFIIVALAQLFIPAKMILDKEAVLNTGTAYKFKTQPVDPSDPFRGKYVALQYKINSFTTNDTTWQRKQKVYVYIENDNLGFAKAKQISATPIITDLDYIIAEANYYDKRLKMLRFNLPFNRFYMEETKAKPAEIAHTKAQRDSRTNNTYALVYVKKGKSVLANVFINDIPISDYVEK